MSDEPIPVNTPETLGVTPRYVLQHNKISRSVNTLSATARKLTAMAMALLPPDMSSLTAAFTFTDFCKAMGFEKGGESYKIFKDAVDECMKCVITVETTPDEKEKKKWEKFTWFTHASFNEATGQAIMEFSDKLASFLAALKWVYAKIDLQAVGTLQSKYAIHLYELLISYSFLKGKNGNKTNKWYVQIAIPELRFIMGTPERAYKETHLFKQKVIDGPVKEINQAGIGIEIAIEPIKQGRTLAAICFDCKKTPQKLPVKGKGRKKTAETQPEQSVIALKTADQREEKELDHLKELYPQEFAELYTEELGKPSFVPPDSELRKLAAEGVVLKALKTKHGIVK